MAEPIIVTYRKGARANKAHIAFEYIKKLWKFIDAEFAQNSP